MVTDNLTQQTSTRLWALMSAALFALGGIWLQNQYNAQQSQAEQMLQLQRQQNELLRYIDERYVERDMLGQISTENNRRMTIIEQKLDKLIELNNGRNHVAPR